MFCDNSEKTELLIICKPQQLKKLQLSSIMMDNIEIKTVENVPIKLVVAFDKETTMEKHVKKMCLLQFEEYLKDP